MEMQEDATEQTAEKTPPQILPSPGPWTAEPSESERNSLRIRDADGRCLALLFPALLTDKQKGMGLMVEPTPECIAESEHNAAVMAGSFAMFEALKAWEVMEDRVANCEEHAPEEAPESCVWCLPYCDRARLMMRAALAMVRGEACAHDAFKAAYDRQIADENGFMSVRALDALEIRFWDNLYVPWTSPDGTNKQIFILTEDDTPSPCAYAFRDADKARAFLETEPLAVEQIAGGAQSGVEIITFQALALQVAAIVIDQEVTALIDEGTKDLLSLGKVVPSPDGGMGMIPCVTLDINPVKGTEDDNA